MTAQIFQQHLNQEIRPLDVLGDWGKPRQVMKKTGPVEAPIAEPFHKFDKLFAPGLIPPALPDERRWADTELPRNE
jgi:hypothetical protein